MPEISTKPYLLRAIYEWCTDSGFTPYIAVRVDGRTRVPMEFVRNGEIVLNISFGATSGLKMDNDLIHFNARFGGVSREISVPVENVLAIYANENGQGMAFEAPVLQVLNEDEQTNPAGTGPEATPSPQPAPTGVPTLSSVPSKNSESSLQSPNDDPEPPKKGPRPTLTRIK